MTLLGKETCSRSFKKNRKKLSEASVAFSCHVTSPAFAPATATSRCQARSAGYRAVPAGAKSSTA